MRLPEARAGAAGTFRGMIRSALLVIPLSLTLLSCAPFAAPFEETPEGEGKAGHPSLAPLDIVTAREYARLVIEIDVVEGAEPAPAALDLLEQGLAELRDGGHLDKPDGIEVIVDDTLEPHEEEGHAYTTEEQRALSKDARDLSTEPGTAYIHMLYLDGHTELDEGDSRVLGYAYGGSYIAMFKESIESACDSSTVLGLLAPALQEEACEVTEAGVLVHEVGHLLGLVNNGLDMVTPHQDEAHGAHDEDDGCVMYWLAERSDAVDVVADRFLNGETGVTPFDDECLADLSAAVEASQP